MTPERLDPKTIRGVSVRGPERYQKYVRFIAKSGSDFFVLNTNTSETKSTIPGPEWEIGDGVFINNNLGRWEKTRIGCSGLIRYHLSPRAKSYSLEEYQEKERREKEEFQRLRRKL